MSGLLKIIALLATELETFYLSVSQIPPQMSLCIRRVFPESSRYARQVFHPHPVPSPLPAIIQRDLRQEGGFSLSFGMLQSGFS